jgi:ATP-dependent RNA helicase RhlE
VNRERKRELLAHLIRTQDWSQVLVFTRTKHGANKLTEQLGQDGIAALAIHGNKSQSARTRALAEFKSGRLTVLVATDIAARGIDIDQLPHVVNYDLPNVPEDYVHRIGRTGRAGATGEAVSLVSIDDRDFLRDIEKLIKRTIPQEVVPGFAPDASARPQPAAPAGKRPPNHGARHNGGRQPSAGELHKGARPPSAGAQQKDGRPPNRGAQQRSGTAKPRPAGNGRASTQPGRPA